MFKTGDRKPSVRLDGSLARLLENAAVPAPDVAGSDDLRRRIGMNRMLELVPRLFNIGVEDINALPADRRAALVEQLEAYFKATGRLPDTASRTSPDAVPDATKKVNGLIRDYRALVTARVKSPEVLAALRPSIQQPMTHEFAGQRFANLYAMHLEDIDGLPQEPRVEVAGKLGDALLQHGSNGDHLALSQGQVEYGGIYFHDLRAAARSLERSLQDAGLLPKPMLELMRKVGHDQVRDLVLLELNVTAPSVASVLREKTAEETATLLPSMEAYVTAGRVTGPEAKAFGNTLHALGLTA